MALCRAMADYGMKLVQAVTEQALQAVTDDPKYFKAQALLFTRLSHAVRQAIALENRIANGQIIRRAATPARAATSIQSSCPVQPDAAPRAERLDANFDGVPDEEIATLLALIGADLGITIERPTQMPPPELDPQPPAPTSDPIASPTPPSRPAPQPNSPRPNLAVQPMQIPAEFCSPDPPDTS